LQHFEAYYTLSKDQDWSVVSHFDDLSDEDRLKLIKMRNENVEENLRSLENNSMSLNACIHLQRLYRIVANRYGNSLNEKIEYLKMANEVCKSSKIK
jgi:hypothetical protein